MTIEEILKLGEMGYTKADIEKMSAPDPATEQKKPDPATEQKKPDPATEQKKPDPATEPKPEPKPDDYYSKISAQMAELLSAVQKANIGNDNQPKPITAEEALAAIINPPEVKK